MGDELGNEPQPHARSACIYAKHIGMTAGSQQLANKINT